jgi:YggT family protein
LGFIGLLAYGISWVANIYTWLIVIYTLLSWIPNAYNTKFAAILNRIVGPYLNLFERFIPPIFGISIAPIVAILVMQFLERGLLGFLSFLVTR